MAEMDRVIYVGSTVRLSTFDTSTVEQRRGGRLAKNGKVTYFLLPQCVAW